MSSFKIVNTTIKESVQNSIYNSITNNSQIAFCNATIGNTPVYFNYNSDTNGNIPSESHIVESSYYATIPFNTFMGPNNHFYFDDDGYFYTSEPGYYRISVSFDVMCTDTVPGTNNVQFVIMNQSGGEDNLRFNFTLTGTNTHYSFNGVAPAAFYGLNNYNNYPAEIHTAFEASGVFTMKVDNAHASISFLF